ncbi:dehydrodolichyl diphosphate synthase CPT3-like [Silene latifolia]|uniref:dehydrodolichyl diphosphate synthase CPT3-like n=1 Tax=Silene latifolia TaxID=37657 RepID=UPI003D785FB5
MEETKTKGESMFSNMAYVLRRCLFGVLSVGPIPDHIAFIMDGNRRYAEKCNLEEGAGHELGYMALMSMLRYCYELEVKYVTIYAFSIDNFKRRPEEVQTLMDLIREKIEGLVKEGSLVNQYGVRVHFIGDLKLLDEPVRLAAEKAMAATAGNSKAVLSICIAYTSTNEIMNAVELSCEEKWDELKILDSCGAAYGLTKNFVDLVDVERNMFMKVAPSPDIVVRTSGESRLSNFLLWQSSCSILYSPSIFWPEIGLRHLGWAILKFQRYRSYLEKTKKRV